MTRYEVTVIPVPPLPVCSVGVIKVQVTSQKQCHHGQVLQIMCAFHAWERTSTPEAVHRTQNATSLLGAQECLSERGLPA